MRIAFVGKGGSGKTTTASLFAGYMAHRGKRVLALDADINQHLAGALGYNGQLRSMGLELDVIKKHLRGTNPLFTETTMRKTTPPGTGSRFVTLDHDDWFIAHYTQMAGDVMVAGAGEIPEGNIGVRCYHGLNGAVELTLGHMLDHEDDVVIVDMTAGADAFSSSLFAKVDALVLVVEPTLKSLSVYGQFLPNIKEYDVPMFVVANKVQDSDDKKFIESRVGTVAAYIGQSSFIRQRERGVTLAYSDMEPELEGALEQLAVQLMNVQRDWQLLETRSHRLHRKNADDWMGTETHQHIDPSFSLEEFTKAHL